MLSKNIGMKIANKPSYVLGQESIFIHPCKLKSDLSTSPPSEPITSDPSALSSRRLGGILATLARRFLTKGDNQSDHSQIQSYSIWIIHELKSFHRLLLDMIVQIVVSSCFTDFI